MDTEKLLLSGLCGLRIMERYVNDGSPSGFSHKNNTSKNTNPFESNDNFKLIGFDIPLDSIFIYGSNSIHSDTFYVHPDMISIIKNIENDFGQSNNILVIPTSSSRTVECVNSNYYIKLHYDNIIGRINRSMTYKKAIAGVEISSILENAINNNLLDKSFHILKEISAIILKKPLKRKEEWFGNVIREKQPFGRSSNEICVEVPLFSILSTRSKILGKHQILKYLIKIWNSKSEEIIIEKLLKPLLNNFFDTIIKLGLQNEYNAQNILIGLNKDMFPVAIIYRDFMGFEKDLTLSSKYYDSFPYKCISKNGPNYQIRHSFSFDFKACQYVIKPLIEAFTLLGISNRDRMKTELQNECKNQIKNLPSDYFPNNSWYSHPKTMLNKTRPYKLNKNPYLRN